MVRVALISSSSPQRLWGTPKLAQGKVTISSVLTQRAQEQWGLAHLLSLISVAFPVEITVENTGLEEGKKEMCYQQSPQTLSHPNSLKRKVRVWEHSCHLGLWRSVFTHSELHHYLV